MASDPSAEWLVVELTSYGEKETPAVLQQAATKSLGRCEVYIPAIETEIGEDRAVHYLMPGYAFVRKEKGDREYRRLEGTRLFQSILRSGRGQGLATVPASYIEELRERLRTEVNQGIGVGDVVLICSGPYKNMEATVITEIPEDCTVQVHIELRSKQSIVTLPRGGLKIVDRAPLSLYFARLGYLRGWYKMAKVVLNYRGQVGQITKTLSAYTFATRALLSGRLLFAFLYAYPKREGGLPTAFDVILARIETLRTVVHWHVEGQKLYNLVHFSSLVAVERAMHDKFRVYQWLCRMEQRLRALSQSVEDIVRDLARGGKGIDEMVVQNVLVDGHNLAFRCAYAPALSRLTDRQGRPTGLILGFLRSLGALRKRYPEASLWVTWDGSSKRRRARYPDYKGTRSRKEIAVNVAGTMFDPVAVLREILPGVGVRQAWNPDEEADDVIATLVRGELGGQMNLIFSTDRDFLQLVNASTIFLFPAVGSRKEVLYDVAGVEYQLGVAPARVLHLRALFGDTSDNLPGVPRVPKKVLKALIQEHGSVEGIYTSGLAALNKGQYERIMEAAPQVKINLELMTLINVSLSRIDPDTDSEGAASRLHDLDIKAPPIIQAFLGKPHASS